MDHLESVSNGLGAPSLLLVLMAIRKEIPSTVSISADTGWENDRLWNTGRRSTNEEYFNEIIVPLCKGTHVTPYFVRGVDKNKRARPTLKDQLLRFVATKKVSGIPLFGANGGRHLQTCTDKMKIQACRQQARRLGAKTNRNAQGIHFHEADRRVKGIFLHMDGPWSVYQTTVMINKVDPITGKPMTDERGKRIKIHKPIKWQTHYYPLVDLRMSREDVYRAVEKEGIPYLVSSECDLCPHKDLARWERTSPDVIDEGALIEAAMGGEFFFTDRRIPLKAAIAAMQEDRAKNPEKYKREADFGCKNDICGI